MKICFLLTTRGNYGKTKSIIDALDTELQFITGGFFEQPYNGARITITEGALSAGLIAIEAQTILQQYNPDLIVIVADRFECLPVAMVAAYMNIPIAHLEGGEVSGSIDESIRHAITKLAHLHFPCNERAAARIRRMGETNVFNVGATSFDLLTDDRPIIEPPYNIVIFHPVSSAEEDYNAVVAAVNEFNMKTIWIRPNIDINSEKINNAEFYDGFKLEEFGPLLKNATCVIGNSSSGLRECAFLGTPAVNIGNRQNGRDRGRNVIDVPCNKDAIVSAIRTQMIHGRYEPDYLYGDGKSGKKVAKILMDHRVAIQKKFND